MQWAGGRWAGAGWAYLEDLGVGAAAAAVAGVHPGGRCVIWAVVAQGTAALSHTPAALEAWVGFEAEAAALPLCRALVEVGCRGRLSQRDPMTTHPGQASPPGSPWMFWGLSMTKLPFHTTDRFTGRSLMSLPS